MKKFFNNVQMLETSNYCGKFSKSVSYETLAGGTPTIGREHNDVVGIEGVITRRTLVRRGYLPEQGTHANKESLFSGVTCFMRLPRRIQRMLLVMTIPTLALLFTLATISESRADCEALNRNWTKTCYDTWNPGVADNCGNGCTYTYADGKLTVNATKPGAVIPKGMFAPYYYESGVYPNVTDIEIAGEFKSITQHAFLLNRANIHGKDWVLLVNNSSNNPYEGNSVSGTVIVNDGQTKLSDGPWLRTNFNGTLILPPTITSINEWTLADLSLGPDAKIYCGAENCKQLFSNIDCDEFGKKSGDYWGNLCQTHKEQLLSSGKLMSYPDGCVKMWSTGCIKCKSESFRLNDGYCDRMRYTPAEAAEVLRDDDKNEITITFKK